MQKEITEQENDLIEASEISKTPIPTGRKN